MPSGAITNVVGKARTSYAFENALSPSIACAYGIAFAATNARTIGAASVESTPRNTTSPLPLSFFAAAIKSGVSSRHGGHHVAQSFKTSVLPRKSASVTCLPSSVVRWKSGAGEPTCGPVRASAVAAMIACSMCSLNVGDGADRRDGPSAAHGVDASVDRSLVLGGRDDLELDDLNAVRRDDDRAAERRADPVGAERSDPVLREAAHRQRQLRTGSPGDDETVLERALDRAWEIGTGPGRERERGARTAHDVERDRALLRLLRVPRAMRIDRKSTRLNSSHANISYAV